MGAMFSFEINHKDAKARCGLLTTPHGQVATPVFMPVGTAGTVKGVTPDQLAACGATIILANTYHLMLRPGAQTICDLGGLHKVMAWNNPILTDSGGYQVFSLAHMRKIDDEGATFQSHIDGSQQILTPRSAMEIQRLLGADIIMQLDECAPSAAPKEQLKEAVRRSADWAQLCKRHWQEAGCASARGNSQALFGIQQGGVDLELRAQSARRIVELDLPGYAIGGLSVGEGHQAMCDVLDAVDGQLPHDKPRYLMGVGEPRDILAAVARGIDMFDCVLPTRNGRNAQAFTWQGRIRLRNAQWAADTAPLDTSCNCYTCQHFSRGTLRHLFMAGEMLGPTLLTIHNLHFFADFLSAIRQAITDNTLAAKTATWLDQIYGGDEKP
jgi:queuine tRNA-ribosyltransferase